jgi:uncharacterized protein YgiM (DUF1202 family)
MDGSELGREYKIIATNGLNLRREATTKSEVLLLMENGAIVSLESEEVQNREGYTWYNVRYQGNVGWAASEYLEKLPSRLAEGLLPEVYTFVFEGLNRNITEVNLGNAIAANKITRNNITQSQTQINLDKDFNNTRIYWVSRRDLQDLQVNPPVN